MPNASEEKLRQLYAAMGEAIAYWVQIERALLEVFISAIEPRHPRAAAAAYYANINFRTKLDFVDQAVVARLSQPDIPGKAGKAWALKFDDPLLPVWAALEKRLQKKAVKRNKIAHFEQIVSSGELVLVPPMHNPLNLAKRVALIATGDQEGHLGAKKIAAIIEEFKDVYMDVQSFNKELAKSIGERDA